MMDDDRPSSLSPTCSRFENHCWVKILIAARNLVWRWTTYNTGVVIACSGTCGIAGFSGRRWASRQEHPRNKWATRGRFFAKQLLSLSLSALSVFGIN